MPDPADTPVGMTQSTPPSVDGESQAATETQQFTPADLRNYLLATDRHACVYRELWNNGKCTYLDLRTYLTAQRARAHGSYPTYLHTHAPRPSATADSGPPTPTSAISQAPSMPFQPSAAYTFVGMRCVFGEGQAAVTIIRFANVRSDMLAYGDVEGGLWLVRDVQAEQAVPVKAPTIHRRPITSLDWSPDNTYLLTTSLDGLSVWDVASLSPIRTLATPVASSAITAAVFHCLSANLVLAGTASGNVEVINTSTGGHALSVPAYRKGIKGLQVTVVEVSAHHVYVGDNTGWLHLHRQDIPRPGQLTNLTHMSRVHVAASESPLIGCSYLPFCQAAAAPALLVTARDSTVTVVKVAKEGHLLELHTQCTIYPPMAREIRAVCCPLSVLHCDLPRIVMGSEDTGVHIYNLSSIKTPGAGSKGGGGALGRPLLANTLRGHRAPVASVSWAFDETFLASADCDGTVIVWERANL